MNELAVFEVPLSGRQLVEASAGTGKTWTLCALLLRLLLEKKRPIGHILVVTFTEAATAELRDRIRARLIEVKAHLAEPPPPPANETARDPFVADLLTHLHALGHEDEDLKAGLELALQSFDEASIFTIHGFCQRALGELGFAAGRAQQLEVVKDEAPLRLELAQSFWRRELVPLQNAALLAHMLAKKEGPEDWANELKRLADKPMAQLIWPDAVSSSDAVEAMAQAALAEARASWAASRAQMWTELHAALPNLSKTSFKPEALAQAFADWDELLAASDALSRKLPDKHKLALLTTDKLVPLKNKPAPPEQRFYALAQALLAAREQLQAHLDAELRHLRCRWLQWGLPALAELKAERRLLGFADMLGQLHERLQDPNALAQLRARFPVALIDEFQDTDPQQYAVFRALFEGQSGPCFFVGDPKQAIYRFRQADLPTYLAARDEADAVWTLAHNQRSTPELLAALNGLFKRQAQPFLQKGLDYVPVQAGAKPKPKLTEPEATAALELWTWPVPTAPDVLTKVQATGRVLSALAADIAQRLNTNQLDGKPLRPGHIAVLVRTHRQAAEVAQALAQAGIDSVANGQASVWRSSEAQELHLVLQALLGPARESLQRAALSTVLMGANAAQLAHADDAQQDRWRAQWASWREAAQEGLAPVLRRWLEEAGVAQRLLALPQGERRLTNVLHLFELLQSQVDQSPMALLAWMQAQRHDAGEAEDAQLRLESDADRVAIVTVHRSKGLEYPIVYHPFAFEGRSSRGNAKAWAQAVHDGQQLVLDYRGEALPPAAKAALELEDAAEAMRLHYVALTRAVLRCIVAIGPYQVKSGNGYSSKESNHAPIHALVASNGLAHWPSHDLNAQFIAEAWSAPLPHTALRQLDEPVDAAPVLRSPPDARVLQARVAPPLPPLRWVGSFSRLVQPGAVPQAALAEAPPLDPSDFLLFPRGSNAGDCLHAALERADLSAPATWPLAIAQALQLHPPAMEGDAQHWPQQLQHALAQAAQAPLQLPQGTPLRLANLQAERRLLEWPFHLSAPQLDLIKLQQLLQAHSVPSPSLRLPVLRGYLRGFVDLVFEHQGRFYVADWKSNHLGFEAASYTPAALRSTVAQHGYALQGLLYLLALHRHLRHTLSGYEPAEHLGGAVLLFVRGMRPDFGQASGQYWLQAPATLLHGLDALL